MTPSARWTGMAHGEPHQLGSDEKIAYIAAERISYKSISGGEMALMDGKRPQQPTNAEIEKWFVNVPAPDADTFEFALVLGGTVSAGAYTAGAIDFLIEALDCLSKAQQKGALQHKVKLRLIAGTSGGGVCAAIAARALAFDFPHVTHSTPSDGLSGNPFYDTWINTLQLSGFLETDDIGKELRSLFNGKPIDDGAKAIVAFDNNGSAPRARDWVSGPLRIILTLTSLRGVPYRTNFGTKLSQGYVDHADFIRFALLYPGQTLGEARPDELVLGFGSERLPQATNWENFSEFAKATAAFPIGFPPRALVRPTEHYRWRVVPYPPGPGGLTSYMRVWPDWDAMVPEGGSAVPDDWHMLAVDGGATDNEPIQLARASLGGLLSRNPREATAANRAVWLIDPFAGRAPLGPTDIAPFPAELGAVVTTLTQQTRYDTADLLMAGDDNVFSRFMLTPTRRGSNGADLIGEEAIASGGLGAFIGFACPAFMRFDYLLGRQNCQEFLRSTFLLAADNPVFNKWTDAEKAKWRIDPPAGGNVSMLPIIPLLDEAAVNAVPDPWPKGKLDPEQYRDAIEKRFRAIFELELSGSLVRSVLSWVGAHATQGQAADYVIGAMRAYLKKADL
jgi:hypothetical protein